MIRSNVSKVLLVLVLSLALSGSANAGKSFSKGFDCDLFRGDDIFIDFDDGVIVIECDDEDGIIEITDDYKLFIDGDRIELDRGEQKLVKTYYTSFEEILEMAEDLGIGGARLGVQGAKLGLKAVANVIKLIFEDYDSDDLEREMEKEAEKIEKKAEKLEELAEQLEDIADDFERTHRKMRKNIDELDELGWF
ncbi:MAG: DUF2884 family protein [Candidatus Krumholzibacteria bacterium]|nr:DUF2884 family protein [Candidatus Krumholzibacteria bacterium]